MAKHAAGEPLGMGSIELGLDKSPFAQAMRSTTDAFSYALGAMAQQASRFANTVGQTLGFGTVVGGGLLGGAYGAKKIADAYEKQFDQLTTALSKVARTGGDPSEFLRAIDVIKPAMRELDAVTRTSAIATAQWGVAWNKSAEQIAAFIRSSHGLSTALGMPIEEAAKLQYGVRMGDITDLNAYGIFHGKGARQEVIQQRLAETAASGTEMALQIRDSSIGAYKAAKAAARDYASALVEFTVEGMIEVFGEEGRATRASKAQALEQSRAATGSIDARIDRAVSGGYITADQAAQLKAATKAGESQVAGGGRWPLLAKLAFPHLDMLAPSGANMDKLIEVGRFGEKLSTLGGKFIVDYLAGGTAADAAAGAWDASGFGVPTASDLRGRSQLTEEALIGLSGAQDRADEVATGFTAPERSARAVGAMHPLTDSELAIRENTEAIRQNTETMRGSSVPFMVGVNLP